MGVDGRPRIISEKKEMTRTIFNDDPGCLNKWINASWTASLDSIELSETDLKVHPYRLQMCPKINGLDKPNKNRFSRYCRRELKILKSFKRVVFYDEIKFSLSGFVNKQLNENCQARGLERPNDVYQGPNNGTSDMDRCAVSKKK